jgi:hypothetical protein
MSCGSSIATVKVNDAGSSPITFDQRTRRLGAADLGPGPRSVSGPERSVPAARASSSSLSGFVAGRWMPQLDRSRIVPRSYTQRPNPGAKSARRDRRLSSCPHMGRRRSA